MMKDWTDIIGEQLSNMSGTLPADDWKVLQQKYLSSRRRARRAAAFRWGRMELLHILMKNLYLFRAIRLQLIGKTKKAK